MDNVKAIMIVALFLAMKGVSGQQPPNCSCSTIDSSYRIIPCTTPGCSHISSPYCTGNFNTDYTIFRSDIRAGPSDTYSFYGCNCPGTPESSTYNAVFRNLGYYGRTYSYDNCTAFGLNARDISGEIPKGAPDRISCCNYCCNGIFTTSATNTTTFPTTNSSGGDHH